MVNTSADCGKAIDKLAAAPPGRESMPVDQRTPVLTALPLTGRMGTNPRLDMVLS